MVERLRDCLRFRVSSCLTFWRTTKITPKTTNKTIGSTRYIHHTHNTSHNISSVGRIGTSGWNAASTLCDSTYVSQQTDNFSISWTHAQAHAFIHAYGVRTRHSFIHTNVHFVSNLLESIIWLVLPYTCLCFGVNLKLKPGLNVTQPTQNVSFSCLLRTNFINENEFAASHFSWWYAECRMVSIKRDMRYP